MREIENFLSKSYEPGFVTDIEQEVAPKGLNENIIRFIPNSLITE